MTERNKEKETNQPINKHNKINYTYMVFRKTNTL